MLRSQSASSNKSKKPAKASVSGKYSFVTKIQTAKSSYWSRKEKTHLYKLFKKMASEVPAYRDFLRTNKVNVKSIKTAKDLVSVPTMSKKNYLKKNAFSKLAWQGSLHSAQVLTATSGSTGKPTYFARSYEVDEQSSYVHELIFHNTSLSPDKSTLVIVCFGMGIWIGGVITYQAFELMGRRGYPISIITPGINKKEILRALVELAPQYEQVVLVGYPPFLKDIVDSAILQGVSFSKHNIAIIFAAEAFTETFRNHIAKSVGIKNRLTDMINIYGSADIGTMAFETPISVLARKLASKNKKLFSAVFKGASKTPTFAQYIPDFVAFEENDGELLVSGNSALPLFKYSIGDHGGVYTFDELVELFKTHGIDLVKEAVEAGIKNKVTELPFVYVYERADLSTTLYGLQIYPETIKDVLLQKQFIEYTTGKLTLITKYDDKQNQYLEINIESKPKKKASKKLILELVSEIVKNLQEKNSEFCELYKTLGKRAQPKVVFWPYEDTLYFKSGIKQPWVIKENR